MVNKMEKIPQNVSTVDGISFPRFNRLPPEVRLEIWRIAFNTVTPSVAVYSSPGICDDITIAHHHSETRSIPNMAAACREAFGEWMKLTRLVGLGNGFGNRVYIPRTIFLTNTDTIVKEGLEDLKVSITHIAIDVSDSSDIFLAFEALAQFPSLQTVIVMIPSHTVTEQGMLNWQQSLRHKSAVLRCISDLIDGRSRDGEWDKTSSVGWLLRNRLDGPEVRAYYSHDQAPRIKLYIDRTRSSEVDVMGDNPWLLYLYVDD